MDNSIAIAAMILDERELPDSVARATRAERERIAVSCQKQRLKRIKDSYDQGWNDALDVIVAALRA